MQRAKLTDDVVIDIKLMLIYSHLTQKEISDYHKTAQSTVSAIKRGDLYSHVDLH